MKIYFYPGYVSLSSCRVRSPRFFTYLKEKGVELEELNWGGDLDSFPKTPSIIRGSTMMDCNWRSFARKCQELGHFPFYDDQFIMPDGSFSREVLIPELEKFLEKHSKEVMDWKLTIPYLKSVPADDSTLGQSDHTKRQSQLLLKLFKQHLLTEDPKSSRRFKDEYPVIQIGENEDKENSLGGLGFDFKALEQLKKDIDADVKKAAKIPAGHPDLQAFYQKLAWGLEMNLSRLDLAIKLTNYAHGFVNSVAGNPALLVKTFQCRSNAECGTMALQALTKVMLPILVEKLKTLGYPDSDEILTWDYDEPIKF